MTGKYTDGYEPHHPWVLLTYGIAAQVEIDEQIAPLIESLWRQGIETTGCCQGEPGAFEEDLAFIIFRGAVAGERFLRLVFDPEENNYERGCFNGRVMHWKMLDLETRHSLYSPSERWNWYLYPQQQGGWAAEVYLQIHVSFPHADLPEATRRVLAGETQRLSPAP